MRGFISELETAERQKKQAFLKQQIVDQNYDPQQFLNFLLEKKPDRTDVTSWTFDELESQVYLFKKHLELPLKKSWEIKLDDLEVEDGDEAIYYKSVITELKSKSIFSEKPHFVIIDQIDIVDKSIFLGGKQLNYTILVPALNLKTV